MDGRDHQAMSELAEAALILSPSLQSLEITALGTKSDAAMDSEVILLAYLCQVTRQQVMLGRHLAADGWHPTPATVGGLEFPDSVLSRGGTLMVPRLQPGFLAVISHPWSGIVEITTPTGRKQIDLYSAVSRALLINTDSGASFETDPGEILRLRSSFTDIAADASQVDQREAGLPRAAPIATENTQDSRINQRPAPPSLADVVVYATNTHSEHSVDQWISIVEIEPIAGLFVDLARFSIDRDWRMEKLAHDVTSYPVALTSRNGTLKMQAALGGSLAFLCGPEAGIVQLEAFGLHQQIDLYSAQVKLLRIGFDDNHTLPHAAILKHGRVSAAEAQASEAMRHRQDFYVAALSRLSPTLPTGLYVPRWKGVAASTKNLFSQVLPCPHTMEGHPSDVTAEHVRFYAGILLASRVTHFVVSGGDVFWIDIIRRVQWEDPRIRFDLVWHSNYLQMGEQHDWNLLKNWQRAIADGIVTRVAVVKSGLEHVFAGFGAETVFIPNFIRANPQDIRYNGAKDFVGIWLSGSSSYRKVPFASLLALKALPQALLIGAGFDDDSLAMVDEMRIPRGDISRSPLPQQALCRGIQRTGVTFYVTLSECSPMLPLESMHLGVPCLIGACSHLFRSHPYLRRTLVVENPMSSESIATHALIALKEGRLIIDEFCEYAYVEQNLAKEGLERLLG